MYSGPIMRTYYSPGQYSQDVALMAAYGYRAVNVEEIGQTSGLGLTLILIFGLLLTPFCVGVVILCFLPLAFSKRYNVTYVFQPLPMQPAITPPYSQPLSPAAYSQPLAPPYQPTMPPVYSQPLQNPYQPSLPPTYSQPLSQPYQPAMPPAGDHSAAPPTYQPQSVSLGARFSAGMAFLGQEWKRMSSAQRALTIIGIVVVGAVALACAIYILVILSGGAL